MALPPAMPHELRKIDHVKIPGSAIRSMDVSYDADYHDIYGYRSRVISGPSTNYTIQASALEAYYTPPTKSIERAQVKRRIYLFTDPSNNKVRVLCFGFRQTDSEKIEMWADEGYASVSLDIEPSEVDVRWIAPPKGD